MLTRVKWISESIWRALKIEFRGKEQTEPTLGCFLIVGQVESNGICSKLTWSILRENFERMGLSQYAKILHMRNALAVILLTLLLSSNTSVAGQSSNDMPHKDQFDSLEQEKLNAINELRNLRILLAIPYREYRVRPTEEDFLRDACVYNVQEDSIANQFVNLIKNSQLLAYKKSYEWSGSIVGIDYLDSKGKSHSMRFDQDYKGYDRVNGYFDGHPITAKSSLIEATYRVVAKLRINTNCDFFIDSYRK